MLKTKNDIRKSKIPLQGYSMKYCTLLVLSLSILVMSCSSSDDDPGTISSEFRVTKINEQFDSAGSLIVEAVIITDMPDTLATVGFVYTDASSDPDHPEYNVDHTVTVNTFEPDPLNENRYTFTSTINPERMSEFGDGLVWEVRVVAFAISDEGNVSLSEQESFSASKIEIVDLYPRYAAPGSWINVTINRPFENGALYAQGLDTKNQAHDVYMIIGDHAILVDNIITSGQNFSYDFAFQMPDGIEEDTEVKIKVEEYEAAYDRPMKNTGLNFTYITEINREYNTGFFLFSSPGALYLGGGETDEGDLLTDFRKFDIASSQWSQITNYPSDGLVRGMAFTTGENAYCGNPDKLLRYNFTANTWATVPLPTNDLQYNHTFTGALSVVKDGMVYFTNLSSVGDNNFWKFNPATEVYEELPDYPGETLTSNSFRFLNKGTVHNGDLHFLCKKQHWLYDLSGTWTQLTDVSDDGEDIVSFNYDGELYGIVVRIIPGGFFGNTGKSLTLYKYDDESDSWTKDSDVPRISQGSEINAQSASFHILETSDSEVYLCTVQNSNYSFYKINQ